MGYIKANREQQFRPERSKYFSSFTDIFFQGSNRPQKSIARTERWNRFRRGGGEKVLFLSDIKKKRKKSVPALRQEEEERYVSLHTKRQERKRKDPSFLFPSSPPPTCLDSVASQKVSYAKKIAHPLNANENILFFNKKEWPVSCVRI